MREEGFAGERDIPGGMTKDQFVEYKMHEALAEGEGFDLLTMGRPEGQGCYCFANHLIRKFMDELADDYRHVIMDNEAGLEHLSRRTTRDVAHLLLITDPSQRGVVAARRAAELVTELKIAVGQTHLIINRLPGGQLPPALESAAQTVGAPLLGTIPADDTLQEFEFSGRPLVQLGDDSPVVGAVARMMQQILKR